MPRELDDAPAWREVATQTGQATFGLQRVGQRTNHLLACGLFGKLYFFPQRASSDGALTRMQQAGVQQAFAHHRHATGSIQLGGGELAPGSHIGQHRCTA